MAANVQKFRTLSISMNHCLKSRLLLHHYRLLHHGPDTVEELLDRHVVKKEKSLDDDENERLTRQRLTSSRREALSLYRDILRGTRFFMWPNSQGILWRDVLRENARKEFEEARFERDPEVITRLLIGGHDAVQAALDKVVEKQKQEIEKQRRNSNTP
ncbi:PREDICTED: uncharacterized protein LOC109224826 [Nicotiana attenuata]|uniref:Complex 1 LYR protein domain-containing protein n=1 Tax=Nicotiana attenuata TaxID=49451 RepID=A0A1J6J250_NICAT|nr:PREDICTED: uncharacterized protein LOC109224826 [Nicotiana attenuata]XP_019244913.1 PREDICTED: uncharacterized protein LOC109224826 [Nicotiana attenuata]OIT03967.1 hypothetical protein A4A49_36838 [Nicotiana attenuata]